MNIEYQKMRLESIDNAFAELKRNVRNTTALMTISRELNKLFGHTFAVQMLFTKATDPCYIMTVYPEQSTIDRLINSILEEESVNMVHEIWKSNKSWVIEIDRRVIDDSIVALHARECTSLLMHEIGHVIANDAIPNRISRVLKYEFAKVSGAIKTVLRKAEFRKILSLPILDGCNSSSTLYTSNLKEEIAADGFARAMGYQNELSSALEKLIKNSEAVNPDDAMRKTFGLSNVIIGNFEKRQAALNQTTMQRLLGQIPSNFIRAQFKVESPVSNPNFEIMMNYLCEKANEAIDSYYMEFFIGKKKLKRLPEYDVDYVEVECDKVSTNDQKLLLISYIRSKIDMAQYYIDILNNEKARQKYEVPHTMEYLLAYRKQMLMILNKTISKKISAPIYSAVNNVQWPEGYEG